MFEVHIQVKQPGFLDSQNSLLKCEQILFTILEITCQKFVNQFRNKDW